ncbi:hypothetical protein Tcan_16759 [Toxocara canis]|uniref:G-protein coupled receptors family 1 profile domain-containing protein n=2 Tax=Toxocara canis TaxID=6265 RepID=A0A0B2VX15_TOXCA|nr:hypothetical protein Tcan_16759 [Toxocara canis]VDM40010.1 unnamed protein product [Toxocara canis]
MDGSLENFNFTIRTYGCTVVGVLLIAINLPVLSIIIANDRLRKKYRIIAFLLLSNAVTGLLAALSGLARFRYYCQEKGQYKVSSVTCFYESVSVWLIWINLQNGANLLITSIDRLIVVTFPGFYYKNANRLTNWLIVCSFGSTTIIMASSVLSEITSSSRQISALCKEQELFSVGKYNFIEIMRAFFAIAGIMIMVGVLVIMKKRKTMMHVVFTSRTTAAAFVNNQKQYTITVLLSSTFTFFLFVLPTVYQLLLQFQDFRMISHLKLYAVFLSYLNAFNVAAVTVFRQKDVKFRRICQTSSPTVPVSRDPRVPLATKLTKVTQK